MTGSYNSFADKKQKCVYYFQGPIKSKKVSIKSKNVSHCVLFPEIPVCLRDVLLPEPSPNKMPICWIRKRDNLTPVKGKTAMAERAVSRDF